jgi:hypothetical protein
VVVRVGRLGAHLMAIMLGALYRALIEGQASEAAARLATEEVAGYDARIGAIERDLTIIKWMVGTAITLQLLTLGGLVGILWRLVPGRL